MKKICDLLIETRPLELIDIPVPADHEILVRVSCCGVCHTELDEIEGRTVPTTFPMKVGHQVIGYVERCGSKATMVRSLFPYSKILVFARSKSEQEFALSLGAAWTGDVTDTPPWIANAIIDTTPVWKTIVESLVHLKSGGRLVINAIRKESADKDALLKISYQEHLWKEKEIKSIANIIRHDVEAFLKLAASIPILSEVETYPFSQANEALLDLKHKHVKGAKVLVMSK